MTKSSHQNESSPRRCGNTAATAARYGIGADKLRKMRTAGEGPEYRVAGHRTVIYDWAKFEEYLASLPSGGGRK